MNENINNTLATISKKDRKAISAGLGEFRLGKDSQGQAETDFWELAKLVANKDPEALEMLKQPSPWNYSINLLARRINTPTSSS